VTSNTKDIILAISPALFGVIGTVLGARAANQAHTAERREAEDSQARERLLELNDAIANLDRTLQKLDTHRSPEREIALREEEVARRWRVSVRPFRVPERPSSAPASLTERPNLRFLLRRLLLTLLSGPPPYERAPSSSILKIQVSIAPTRD
jgi:hypothetical protein